MRQSKDGFKRKRREEKKKKTPPFETLPATGHAESHFSRDLLIFYPTTFLPPNKQEPCCLLVQVLQFCR
jgi:hypothetical protein